MCWAIPAQVLEIDKDKAKVRLGRLTQTASIALLEDVRVGDYILIHAGFAIQKIDKESAETNLRMLNEILR